MFSHQVECEAGSDCRRSCRERHSDDTDLLKRKERKSGEASSEPDRLCRTVAVMFMGLVSIMWS